MTPWPPAPRDVEPTNTPREHHCRRSRSNSAKRKKCQPAHGHRGSSAARRCKGVAENCKRVARSPIDPSLSPRPTGLRCSSSSTLNVCAVDINIWVFLQSAGASRTAAPAARARASGSGRRRRCWQQHGAYLSDDNGHVVDDALRLLQARREEGGRGGETRVTAAAPPSPLLPPHRPLTCHRVPARSARRLRASCKCCSGGGGGGGSSAAAASPPSAAAAATAASHSPSVSA